jgi:hypothetical protein
MGTVERMAVLRLMAQSGVHGVLELQGCRRGGMQAMAGTMDGLPMKGFSGALP